jgi:ABC-type glycerol-3-phosphate transport system substrate-binding protein
MKKIMIRLCAVACIGLALTACGGHKANNTNNTTQAAPQTVIDTMGANHPEEKDRKGHPVPGDTTKHK